MVVQSLCEIGYGGRKRCVLRGLTTNNSNDTNDTNEENEQTKRLATKDTRGHKSLSGIYADGMEWGCLGILLWAFVWLVAERLFVLKGFSEPLIVLTLRWSWFSFVAFV